MNENETSGIPLTRHPKDQADVEEVEPRSHGSERDH
jgi:hypothetical protein